MKKNFGGLRGAPHAKRNQAKSCQQHAKSSKIMSCKKTMQKLCKKLFSPSVTAHTAWENLSRQAKSCKTSSRPSAHSLPGECGRTARPSKKTGPVKKRMASWQRQQITEAADGGARARTGADGAVVLNLQTGGLCAALARGRAADPGGPALQLSPGPAGPPARTSTTTSPSSARGPTTTSCCATGRRSSCAPCRAA